LVRARYIVSGLSVLLISSFFDNMRGPLVPLFAHELGLDYAKTSLFLVVGTFTAVAVTAFLIPLLARYGSRLITIGLGFVGLGTIALSYAVQGFVSLIVLAVLSGATVAGGGAICNVLVMEGTDLDRRSRIMCLLHAMYGVGSLIAPLVVSQLVSRGFSWPAVFTTAAVPLAVLISGVAISLPRHDPKQIEEGTPLKWPSRLQALILFAFSIYVAGEVMTSMWMVTYLVEGKGLTVVTAAPYLTGFFLMMALTRLLCFFSIKPENERWILGLCLVLSMGGITLGLSGFLWGFSLAGALGPYFPLFLARVGRTFPTEARPLTLWILTSMQLTLALFHISIGKLTDSLGIQSAYWLSPGLLLAALGLLFVYFAAERTGALAPAAAS
jgi:MFS family permease